MKHPSSPAKSFLAAGLLALFTLAGSAAHAVSSTFQVLMDFDPGTGIGCTVATAAGPVNGVDRIEVVTVDTAGAGSAQVTQVQTRSCTVPPSTFSAPAAIAGVPPTPYTVGIGNAPGGLNVIEFAYPLALSSNQGATEVRLAVVSSDGGAVSDALITTTPGGNLPIIITLLGIAEVPTLGEVGLFALAFVLAAAALLVLRRRRTATALMMAFLLLGLSGLAFAAASDLNGTTTSEWGAALATDPVETPPNPPGADLGAFYGMKDAATGRLNFRIDSTLTFNQTPVANDQAVNGTEDNPLPITLTGSDADGDPLTFSLLTAPAHGTLSALSNPTATSADVTYTPTPDFNGTDTFDFQVSDGNGGTDAGTISITISGADDPPLAVDDAATVNEDSGANAVAVLTNDTDVDAGPKSISAVTQPANGTVVITGGGTGLTYAPNANYCNTPPGTTLDTFTYTLAPGGDTATVTMTVTCVDDSPVAVADAATVNEDSGANAVNVLANDTDVDAGPMSVASVTQPTNGVVVITGGGTGLTYAPNANYCNQPPGTTLDTFTYTLAPGGSSTTVTMTVTCVDDNPVAVADAATVAEDSGASAVPVLANDTDVDAGAISISAVTQPANGAVVITGGGTGLTYAPNANYCNQPPGTALDTFTYTLSPGGSSATVTMTVTCVDDNPVAVADAATVGEDSGANAVNVLANDTDVDAGPKSVASVTQPANGAVVITGGGTGLTYAPNANYCNTPPGTALDTFTYTLAPGGSSTTVTMSVTCSDDPPAAVNDAATVNEDSGANAINVLANDTDVDGGPKSVTAVTQPANGAVVITGGGTGVTYAPNANYCNTPPGTALDTFTYTLTPGGNSATVSVAVTCINDAPAIDLDANDDQGTTGANFAVTFTEGDAAKLIEDPADAVLTDIDNATLASLTVTLTNLFDTGLETLSTDTTGTSIVAVYATVAGAPGTGTLTLTGPDTLANFQTVLRKVRYRNTDVDPDVTPRVINFVANDGTANSNTATATVTIVAVDTPPVAVADAATVNEDSGASAVNVLANDTDVDGGPKSIASVTQPANGTVVITGGGTGLTYAPNANYCNTPPGTTLDTFTYTLTPGSSSTTVTMSVTCVDDNPVAVADAATVTEDSGANAVPVLANDTDPDGGPKSISAVTQPANGAVVITGGGTGLTYAPNANYCNTPPGTTLDTFTYTLTPGGSSTTVTMSVTCVDDNPVAVADAATVVEDSGASAVNVLANDTDIDAGPKSVASVTQPANGAVVITGGGTGLTYAPNANYCNNPPGTTLDTFTYTLTPGGSSTTVTMTVTCVDDPPVAVADSATVNEDSGANAINVLANDTDIDAGPKSVASVTQPANGTVVITGGGTGLTYAPNANYCNNPPGTTLSTFTYTLTPGSSSTTVTVTVTCVNDPPVADNDSFDFVGNTELRVDVGAAATPHVLAVTPSTFGVLDGDSDPVEGDAIAISSITVGACTDNAGPFDCTDAGIGTVHAQTNGRFSFEPAPGVTGAAPTGCPAGAVDKFTFTYILTDNGVPAPASAAPATVTLCRFARVWYVDSSKPAGNGTSASPFNVLTTLNGAGGAGDPDVANDTIFVHMGNTGTTPLTGGIELENGEHLIGEHAGLSVPFSLNGGPNPTPLVTAVVGNRPQIDNSTAGGSAVSASNAIPTEITGVSLLGNTNGIDLTLAAAFTGTGALEIRDNVIRGSGIEGIDVNGAGGAASVLNLNIHDNAITAGVRGIDVLRTTGTVRITGFANNVVSGNTGGSGIEITGATFDSTPADTAITTVSGGTTVVGASGNGVSTNGILLTSVTGDLAFTDLDIFNDAGAGLRVTGTGVLNAGAGTGFKVAVGAGVSTLDSNGGPVVDVSNASVSLPINFLRSTNSPTTGLSLVNAFGGVGGTALSAGSGQIADPVGASGVAVNVDGGTGNVTLPIPIINTSGNAVTISNRTGDTVAFTGLITESGSGLAMTANTGGTIRYSGGLTATTGTSTAFSATGGGTVEVCDENPCNPAATGATVNTLTTTTGTALNVANTTIGANNLEFRSITAGTAASGPANGVLLNTTGTTGGLKIKGNGSAGSGGTIQRAGTGLSLTSTRNVSLSRMQLNDFGDWAIRGSSVVNFAIDNSIINGTNGDNPGADEGAVRFTELTGTASVANCNISGGVENNFTVVNTTGTLNRLTVSATTFGANSVASGDDGLLVEGQQTAVVNTTVQNSFFTSTRGDHFQLNLTDTASADLAFTGNTISNAHPAVVSGGGGIRLTGGSAGGNVTATYNFSNNTIRDSNGTAIGITKGSGAGTFTGTIDNNQIGVAAVANSGSAAGSGISVILAETGTHTTTVTNNQIRQYNNFGIIVQAGGTATVGSGSLKATVTGNTVSNPGTMIFAKNGFQLNSGTLPGETYQACLTFGGAGALRNSLVGAGTDGGTDFRLRQRQSTTVRLPGYAGANNDDAAVQTFAQGNNNLGGTPTASATNTVPTGGGWIGGVCP